jgi:hypothetical protein
MGLLEPARRHRRLRRRPALSRESGMPVGLSGGNEIVPEEDCPVCGFRSAKAFRFCPQCGRIRASFAPKSPGGVGRRIALWAVLLLVFLLILKVYPSNRQEVQKALSQQEKGTGGNYLVVSSWTCKIPTYPNSIKIAGEVKNTSQSAVDRLEVMGSARTGDGTFASAEDGRVEYRPLLPGQTSPFWVLIDYNPAIRSAALSFKDSEGSVIAFSGPRTQPCAIDANPY